MNLTIQCNKCARDDCPKETYEKKTTECPMYKEIEPATMPLLRYLLMDERKAQAVVQLLHRFNIRIEETKHYPNFKLILQ